MPRIQRLNSTEVAMIRKSISIILASLLCVCLFGFIDTTTAASTGESMLVETTSITSFSGTWEEIGLQIGQTYPDYIMDFGKIMGFVLLMAGPGNGWTAQAYYDRIQDLVPQSIKDHMQGMAAGAAESLHMSYDLAWNMVLTQNFATELLNMENMSGIPAAAASQILGCTAFAVTSAAGTFLCHNTDATAMSDNIVVLMHWQPTNGDFGYMTMDPPGWADVAFGLNEKGIGVTMNAGNPNIDARIGLPINFMLRYVMEHAATLDEAVGYIDDFIKDGNNFGTGGALVHIMDFNTAAMAKIQVRSESLDITYGQDSTQGNHYIASANHFVGSFNPDPEYYYESSFMRYERLLELMEQTKTFDREACWTVLSDTNGAEENSNTISRVTSSGGTMFGLVITADGFQYTMGPPSMYIGKFGEPPQVSYSAVAENCVTSFTAAPQSRKAVLTWQTRENTDITGFKLYRATGQKETYELLQELQAGTNSAEDTGLKNKTRYYYRLEALHRDGTTTVHGPVCTTPKLRYALQ